jgi:hypothetical protein
MVSAVRRAQPELASKKKERQPMPSSIATPTAQQEIDLSCPLSLRTAFRFPIQSY